MTLLEELRKEYTVATLEELEQDYLSYKDCHPGVLQALYDLFPNDDLEIWPDYGAHGIPVWSKTIC